MQNYLVLIGIVIIVVGFVLKLDVISVVLIAGFATGLAGGKSIVEILDIIGKGFVTNRYMSLFFTTLIVIGIMERNGLKEKAADGIRKIKGASADLVIFTYPLDCSDIFFAFRWTYPICKTFNFTYG